MTDPRPVSASLRSRWLWLGFAWGFAEATFFFLVPDILITRIAIRGNLRAALLASACALIGALIGGTVLYYLGQGETALPLLRASRSLPGINAEVVALTGQAIYDHGPKALLAGGLIGQPYKLFALHAGVQHVPLGVFLLFSVAARFSRFTLSALIAWAIGRGLKHWSPTTLVRLHAFVWSGFYLFYFLRIR